MSGELAGALRETVTVERRGTERDALGGAAGAWAQVGGPLSAAIGIDGRGAAVAGDAVAGLPLWRVTVRAPSAVLVGDRLVWGAKELAVRRVEADPRAPDRVVIVAEETR